MRLYSAHYGNLIMWGTVAWCKGSWEDICFVSSWICYYLSMHCLRRQQSWHNSHDLEQNKSEGKKIHGEMERKLERIIISGGWFVTIEILLVDRPIDLMDVL